MFPTNCIAKSGTFLCPAARALGACLAHGGAGGSELSE